MEKLNNEITRIMFESHNKSMLQGKMYKFTTYLFYDYNKIPNPAKVSAHEVIPKMPDPTVQEMIPGYLDNTGGITWEKVGEPIKLRR